jgi:hypothetical protein
MGKIKSLIKMNLNNLLSALYQTYKMENNIIFLAKWISIKMEVFHLNKFKPSFCNTKYH